MLEASTTSPQCPNLRIHANRPLTCLESYDGECRSELSWELSVNRRRSSGGGRHPDFHVRVKPTPRRNRRRGRFGLTDSMQDRMVQIGSTTSPSQALPRDIPPLRRRAMVVSPPPVPLTS